VPVSLWSALWSRVPSREDSVTVNPENTGGA
jgi:hypothetical protein